MIFTNTLSIEGGKNIKIPNGKFVRKGRFSVEMYQVSWRENFCVSTNRFWMRLKKAIWINFYREAETAERKKSIDSREQLIMKFNDIRLLVSFIRRADDITKHRTPYVNRWTTDYHYLRYPWTNINSINPKQWHKSINVWYYVAFRVFVVRLLHFGSIHSIWFKLYKRPLFYFHWAEHQFPQKCFTFFLVHR